MIVTLARFSNAKIQENAGRERVVLQGGFLLSKPLILQVYDANMPIGILIADGARNLYRSSSGGPVTFSY